MKTDKESGHPQKIGTGRDNLALAMALYQMMQLDFLTHGPDTVRLEAIEQD